MIFSKVVDNIVVHVINVENFQWIIDNPERYGDSSLYVETDPNNLTKPWGEIGFSYDVEKNQFMSPKPFDSWILNENGFWKAPITKPEGNFYWDEDSLSWLAFPVG